MHGRMMFAGLALALSAVLAAPALAGNELQQGRAQWGPQGGTQGGWIDGEDRSEPPEPPDVKPPRPEPESWPDQRDRRHRADRRHRRRGGVIWVGPIPGVRVWTPEPAEPAEPDLPVEPVAPAEPVIPPDPEGPLRLAPARGAAPAAERWRLGAALPPDLPHVTLNWRRYDLPEPPPGRIYARVGRAVLLITADGRVVEEIVDGD